MKRSWPQCVLVTPQWTGLVLPCLALLPPYMFNWYKSIQLGSNVVMSISDSMPMCLWVFEY